MQVNDFSNNLTFQAMKPSQFSGIDYAIVRKFKAPVEKFNSTVDFQTWSRGKFLEIKDSIFKNISDLVSIERKLVLSSWRDFLACKEGSWSPSKILLIFSALIKGLKQNNDLVPYVLRESVLDKSLVIIEGQLSENKDAHINLNKVYGENLEEYLLKDIPENYTGWLILPSQRKDNLNFKDNIERLKIFSRKKWCTKDGLIAESYLQNGDFHLYFDNGMPKVAIRFSGVEIQEIQGEKNKMVLPQKYMYEVKKHINDGSYFHNDDIDFLIDMIERGI